MLRHPDNYIKCQPLVEDVTIVARIAKCLDVRHVQYNSHSFRMKRRDAVVMHMCTTDRDGDYYVVFQSIPWDAQRKVASVGLCVTRDIHTHNNNNNTNIHTYTSTTIQSKARLVSYVFVHVRANVHVLFVPFFTGPRRGIRRITLEPGNGFWIQDGANGNCVLHFLGSWRWHGVVRFMQSCRKRCVL